MSLGTDLSSEWLDVQRRVVALWDQEEYEGASKELERFLALELLPYFRSEALAYLSETKEQQGEVAEAREVLLKAHALSEQGSYSRYTLELTLGRFCEQLAQSDDALSWYVAALRSSAESADVSCGSALNSLIRVLGDAPLEGEVADVALSAARQAWAYFGLGGRPDGMSLKKVADTLRRKEQEPPPA